MDAEAVARWNCPADSVGPMRNVYVSAAMLSGSADHRSVRRTVTVKRPVCSTRSAYDSLNHLLSLGVGRWHGRADLL